MVACGRISVISGPAATVGPAGKLLILLLVKIPLLGQARNILLELLHLALKRTLLALKHVPLLHALVAAGLCVAAVLQCASLLLETDHLLLTEASQLPVKLTHRHADQLLVREAVLKAGVMAMVVVMMMGLMMMTRGGRGQVLPYVLLPAEALVGLMVVMMVVGVSNEGLNGVLRGQIKCLGVDVVLVAGDPVKVLKLRLTRSTLCVASTVAAVNTVSEVLV